MKELSKQDSIKYVRTILKQNVTNVKKKLQPGRIIMFKYDAKDKTVVYDKTPLVFVLKASKRRMLGLNFHWLPFNKRIEFVRYIMKTNKRNIKNNVPLVFNYNSARAFLKKGKYYPVIRMYIRTRIGSKGVLIPDDNFLHISRTKTGTFSTPSTPKKQ